VTLAPEMLDPDLSVTTPKKLPVACPWAICAQQSTPRRSVATK
jgi:hypothetical protein